ncbi:MAG: hypothetical protein A2W91_01720 [Bacteroidetes bacterium GWF2_38_335]|nr:MAG: hypothetical protein A2W91_01720 [Bacteroidetes bacterium GWF2_38_335]OFY78787.1 MAG: hypothetical protein A2281_19295 [Bacteroidetes bacterium RIFOXYA12_FULL_38_20]HBS85182.1 hypothetical protein [Bacteroidales bacterium]
MKILLLSIALIVLLKVSAQSNFEMMFDVTSYNDLGVDVIQTADGGYLVLGKYDSNFSIIKTDSYGIQQNVKLFDWIKPVFVSDIEKSADNGAVICGKILTDTSGYDFFVMKINSEGDSLWSKVYYGENDENAVKIIRTEDLGYVIAGSDQTINFKIIKTDSDGNELWTYNDDSINVSDVCVGSDGGIVIVGGGYYYCYPKFGTIMKINAAGPYQWSQTFSNSSSTLLEVMVSTVTNTQDNGFIISVYFNDDGVPSSYYYKLDSIGNTLFTKRVIADHIWVYAPPNIPIVDINSSSDGSYYITGHRNYPLNYFQKFDSSDKMIWEKSIGNGKFILTDDNCFVFIGTEANMIYIAKADENGNGCFQVQGSYDIGLVTNDETTGKNKIIWTPSPFMEKYHLYRSDGSLVKSVNSGEPTEVLDELSDPNEVVGYYITVEDTCGNLTFDFGDYPEYYMPVFQCDFNLLLEKPITNTSIGYDLDWNSISNYHDNPMFPYGSPIIGYRIYRGISIDNMILIDSTDIETDYLDLIDTTQNLYYRISAVLQNYCTSSLGETFNEAFSNIWQTHGSDINNVVIEKYCIEVFPNPFDYYFVVSYELSEKTDVGFEIYNQSGQLIKAIPSEKKNPGIHKTKLNLNESNLEPGVYTLKIIIGAKLIFRKQVKI